MRLRSRLLLRVQGWSLIVACTVYNLLMDHYVVRTYIVDTFARYYKLLCFWCLYILYSLDSMFASGCRKITVDNERIRLTLRLTLCCNVVYYLHYLVEFGTICISRYAYCTKNLFLKLFLRLC